MTMRSDSRSVFASSSAFADASEKHAALLSNVATAAPCHLVCGQQLRIRCYLLDPQDPFVSRENRRGESEQTAEHADQAAEPLANHCASLVTAVRVIASRMRARNELIGRREPALP